MFFLTTFNKSSKKLSRSLFNIESQYCNYILLLFTQRKYLGSLNSRINDNFGYKRPEKSYRSFNEYFLEILNDRQKTGVNLVSWDCVYKHLNNFNKCILFAEISERLLEEFKSFLLSKLKPNSACSYFNTLKNSLLEYYKINLIKNNPADRVKSVKEVDTNREYLTKEEVEKLINTECRYDVLKRAFLFSCMTGLRWSDVNNLKWKDVRIIDDVSHIIYTQKKTKNSEVLPISSNTAYFICISKSNAFTKPNQNEDL